ncbi:hypothetical protein PsYK624_077970 [Phanerochaete sordida]|uniref:Uncharacterized protein n=1 Tax=Phanerochaete sordida TaxID=48140 RepID=A0A9P3LF41_9APHY|nr:hypothetical protein PsYK624_077970 [Phanerochaete sordida]
MKPTAALTALTALACTAIASPLMRRNDSYACFQATVNGAEKFTAVKALSVLLANYSTVIPGGGIATEFGNNAVVYVCNFSGANIDADPQANLNYDININSHCGPSTAGRVRLDSGLEYGRTAIGKAFCDGS